MVARFLLAALCITISCAPPIPGKGGAPRLRTEARTWDFGTMERGEISKGRIVIANDGTDTLRIGIYSTCDCLSVTPDRAAVSPGERQIIRLSYIGDEIKAKIAKTIFIDSNDPEVPRVTIEVRGTVTPGRAPHLVAIPNPLPLDPASATYPQVELKLQNHGEEVLKVGAVTCFGCVNAWNHGSLASGEEVVIEVIPLPDWTDRRWLEIESNDPVEPLKKVTIVDLD